MRAQNEEFQGQLQDKRAQLEQLRDRFNRFSHRVVFETLLTRNADHTVLGSGDPNWSNLGTGTLWILESTHENELHSIVQLISYDGTKRFEAKLPGADGHDAHEHMFVAPGELNTLQWNAYDTSGDSDSPLFRRFTFRFVDGPQMFTFIAIGFRGNHVLANEFLTPGSRFYRNGSTSPAYNMIRDIHRMSVDGEEYADQYLPRGAAPCDSEEEEELYGPGVNHESQF